MYKFVLESINSKISIKIHKCFIIFFIRMKHKRILYYYISQVFSYKPVMNLNIVSCLYKDNQVCYSNKATSTTSCFFWLFCTHIIYPYITTSCVSIFHFWSKYPKFYSITMQHLRSLAEKNVYHAIILF